MAMLALQRTAALAIILAASYLPGTVFSQELPPRGPTNVDDVDTPCASRLRPFDPILHKRRYRIGIHKMHNDPQDVMNQYSKTFVDYLTATAGQRFTEPLDFELVPLDFEDFFTSGDDDVDFVFSNPGTFSCVNVERTAQPLATLIRRYQTRSRVVDLDQGAGVIFVRADRKDIHDFDALPGKIVAAEDISSVKGGQAQLYQMLEEGLDYVMDPSQMVFTGSQDAVVRGVLDGSFDVGLVNIFQIEQTKYPNGTDIDVDLFHVLEPHFHKMPNDELFPFVHSTYLYPEWPFAALTHVDYSVSMEVGDALMALQEHALAHQHLLDQDSFAPTRCDTTRNLAELAWQASTTGGLAGFRSPRSYVHVHDMQQEIGVMHKNSEDHWECYHADTLYDKIECPKDYYKKSRAEYEQSCEEAGLPCPRGATCFCQPCTKAFEVDVFEWTEELAEKAESGSFLHPNGCAKMSVCGTVQQTKNITFRIVDNLHRENPVVEAKMHMAHETKNLPVKVIKPDHYEIVEMEYLTGVGLLEIFFDGEQIPESPLRLTVTDRNCDEDFPGQKMDNEEDGTCVCRSGTIEIAGECVDSIIITIAISALALIIVTTVGYIFMRLRIKKADEIWKVDIADLQFSDPVEIIGEGSFGLVIRASYRGTAVALKQARNSKRGKSKSGTRSKVKSSDKKVSDESSDLNVRSTHSIRSGDVVSLDTTEDLGELDPEFGKQYFDKEKQGDSANPNGFMSGSMSFLGSGRGTSRWWTSSRGRSRRGKDDHTERFHQAIFGSGAASKSSKSMVNYLLPCLADQQKNDFMNEMRVLSRLRHPCITTVMGAVISKHHDPMLVMELMEYGSLYDLLRNDTMYLSGEIIMQVVRDVAQGLRFLHTSRPPVFHGDLKGRNVLIDSHFRAKLCDFGLSSKNKRISGTPYFLAPEYLRGRQPYDAKCDIYSLGIVLYEIYSRKDPYHGEPFREVLRKVCDRRVNKRPPIPGACPPKMVDLMKKCWSADPLMRPRASELDTLLQAMRMQDAEPLATEQQNKRSTVDMLHEIFPKHIAEALKAGQKVEPEQHDEVTVIFSDIVKFTDISRNISPLKVSQMLDRLYLAFDTLARKHGVFKVETIGDAYMGVTNLTKDQEYTHVKVAALFAIDLVAEASKILIDETDPVKGYVNVRVGFHSGPVVSNVIGSLNPRYGLFGDTVNTSSRMESNSQANRILCSETSYQLLVTQAPEIPVKRRGKIAVKGKGDMLVYWVGESRGHKARFANPPPLDEFAMENMSDSHSSLNDPFRDYLKGELKKMDDEPRKEVIFEEDHTESEKEEHLGNKPEQAPQVACV